MHCTVTGVVNLNQKRWGVVQVSRLSWSLFWEMVRNAIHEILGMTIPDIAVRAAATLPNSRCALFPLVGRVSRTVLRSLFDLLLPPLPTILGVSVTEKQDFLSIGYSRKEGNGNWYWA